MAYSEKVIDHYENPRIVWTLDKADPNVGTGLVGAPACGDVMRLQLKISDEGIGMIKVVSDKKYDEVLGIHMVGPHATELLAEACVALRLEITTEELGRTIHAHPTLSEIVKEGAEAALGTPIHI